VTRLALIGYGQVRVYGDQIPTATVDPATYRAFTPAGTRGSAAVWKAVTDGKALVSHTVGNRDHLRLDVTVPAGWATVRVAGLATTVPGVDMVVSSTTGERIGVPFGNGLVLAVSGDPERASAKVRAVLGAQPVIRRIAPFGGALGAPAGPALPAVTPTVPPATPPAAPRATPPVVLRSRAGRRPDAFRADGTGRLGLHGGAVPRLPDDTFSCRDERAVISRTLTRLRETFPAGHIWVIDDDSDDGTDEVIAEVIEHDPIAVSCACRTWSSARAPPAGTGDPGTDRRAHADARGRAARHPS
jgi:hypothetical protein